MQTRLLRGRGCGEHSQEVSGSVRAFSLTCPHSLLLFPMRQSQSLPMEITVSPWLPTVSPVYSLCSASSPARECSPVMKAGDLLGFLHRYSLCRRLQSLSSRCFFTRMSALVAIFLAITCWEPPLSCMSPSALPPSVNLQLRNWGAGGWDGLAWSPVQTHQMHDDQKVLPLTQFSHL